MSLYFWNETHSGLDINSDAAKSDIIDMAKFRTISYDARLASDTFGSAILHIQCSCDAINWKDVASTELTGPGLFSGVEIRTRYARIKVKTAEGSPGTANLIIQLKK